MSKTEAHKLMMRWAERVQAFIAEGDSTSEARQYADAMLAHLESLAKEVR